MYESKAQTLLPTGLFVGLIFMATLGLTLAPVAHRLIHKFHLDDDQS